MITIKCKDCNKSIMISFPNRYDIMIYMITDFCDCENEDQKV